MLRVRDIMTRHVVSLAVEASLDSAAWKLANEAVTGAPVRDQHGNVVGVLSRSDLADALRLGETDRSVGEAMTAGVWAVHPDAPAIEAVQLMVDCGIHRAVVLRGPGRLEGIVTAMDIMRALARGGDFLASSATQDSEDSRSNAQDSEPRARAAEARP